MNDNFDLKAYLGSKRLLTENYESLEELGPKISTEKDEYGGLNPDDYDLMDDGSMVDPETGKTVWTPTEGRINEEDEDEDLKDYKAKFPDTDTEEHNEVEYGSEKEGTYPWSKHEDNYPDVNISDEVPIIMDEPEDEEPIAEEATPDLEEELMSQLDEDFTSTVADAGGLVGVASAAVFAANVVKLLGSGAIESLKNGAMGEKGKEFVDTLRSLVKK